MSAPRFIPGELLDAARDGRLTAEAILLWAEIDSLHRFGRHGRCDASIVHFASQLPDVDAHAAGIFSA